MKCIGCGFEPKTSQAAQWWTSDGYCDNMCRTWYEGKKQKSLNTSTMIKASIIFDIDGTLADCEHRLHLAKAKRWDEFFELCDKDTLITPIAQSLHNLYRIGGFEIVLITGRPERIRRKTFDWMHDHSLPFTTIYMRADGDHRQDHIVKRELLERCFSDGHNPIMAFDDSDGVIRAFRESGLPTFSVK